MAAEGILQLQDVVVHSIAAVSDAPRGVLVHRPSKEFDLYALLELEPGEVAVATPPDETPPEMLEDAVEAMDDEGEGGDGVEVAGSTLAGTDIDSFEEFLFSWK